MILLPLGLLPQRRQTIDPFCGCASQAAVAANEAALAAHRKRCLDEASAAYDRALKLAPPRLPTAAEQELAIRFAPIAWTTAQEPFALKDVVAIVHPTKPWIAYHFFWDDDIDFPDDNDPSDHEVMWIELDEKRQRLVNYYTYFHSRVFAAPPPAVAEALEHGGHASVDVQWGKHGTMPLFWKSLLIVADSHDVEAAYYPLGHPITLETYNRGIFAKLSTVGRRAQDCPIGKNWPRKFQGSWEQFVDFSKRIDTGSLLHQKNMIEVTCFANAVLNRHFLAYNFRAKIEWPAELCKRN